MKKTAVNYHDSTSANAGGQYASLRIPNHKHGLSFMVDSTSGDLCIDMALSDLPMFDSSADAIVEDLARAGITDTRTVEQLMDAFAGHIYGEMVASRIRKAIAES